MIEAIQDMAMEEDVRAQTGGLCPGRVSLGKQNLEAPLLAVAEFGISSVDDEVWEEPILFWSWCPESPPLPFSF